MAAPTSWSRKINHIRKALDTFPAPELSRADVETLFGVKRSQADEIMSAAGARLVNPAGGARVKLVAKCALQEYLLNGKAGQQAEVERGRAAKVQAVLESSRAEAQLRAVAIQATPGDRWTTLDELLPYLSFEPGVLKISHSGIEDLVRRMYRLGQALGTELDRFERLLEGEKARRKTA